MKKYLFCRSSLRVENYFKNNLCFVMYILMYLFCIHLRPKLKNFFVKLAFYSLLFLAIHFNDSQFRAQILKEENKRKTKVLQFRLVLTDRIILISFFYFSFILNFDVTTLSI